MAGRVMDFGNIAEVLRARGFRDVENLPGSTYRDNSTVMVTITRGQFSVLPDGRRERRPVIPDKVVASWMALQAPMNQKRTFKFVSGDEVAIGLNRAIQSVLADPELSRWPYILTLEDDNLPIPPAHIYLLESIENAEQGGPFDAVSGIYFTKGEYQMPMAFGDPERSKVTRTLDFIPIDTRELVRSGRLTVIDGEDHGRYLAEVNGVACGCTLWRTELFRKLEPPWFLTLQEFSVWKGTSCSTQDLYFCKRAKLELGARFAVDFRAQVGHYNVEDEEVY